MPSLEAVRLWSTTAASIFIAIVTGIGQLGPGAAAPATTLSSGQPAPVVLLVREVAR